MTLTLLSNLFDRPPKGIGYRGTNENLFSIMEGLDLQEDDVVLSICGSGDQPLAILETASEVHAIDSNPKQIEIANYGIRCLERSKFKKFLSSANKSGQGIDREPYFTIERLLRIQRNLHRLNLYVADLRSLPDSITKRVYSKIYLSNAFGYGMDRLEEKIVSTAQTLVDILSKRGLIYVATTYGFFNKIPSMATDTQLTQKARSHYNRLTGPPSVYRKP